jgi:hypothetical protein
VRERERERERERQRESIETIILNIATVGQIAVDTGIESFKPGDTAGG